MGINGIYFDGYNGGGLFGERRTIIITTTTTNTNTTRELWWYGVGFFNVEYNDGTAKTGMILFFTFLLCARMVIACTRIFLFKRVCVLLFWQMCV